jgi:hypothetical protein
MCEDEFHEMLGLSRGHNATFKTDHKWVAQRPNVKAILTVQDNPDKNVDSWLVAAPFVDLMKQRPFCWMETVQVLMPSFEAEFMHETTDGKPEDKLRDRCVECVRKVQDTAVPSENLLTFNVKEGWKPLDVIFWRFLLRAWVAFVQRMGLFHSLMFMQGPSSREKCTFWNSSLGHGP